VFDGFHRMMRGVAGGEEAIEFLAIPTGFQTRPRF
jgi:hypothetical protein